MIQVTRARDLEQQAGALERDAAELDRAGDNGAAHSKLHEAAQLRELARKMRAGRSDGVRFG